MALSHDAQLADEIAKYYDDPLGHVMFSYPWDEDPSLQVVDWESEEMFVDPKTGFVYDDDPEDIDTVTYKDIMEPYRRRFNCRFGPDLWACQFLDDVGEQVKKRGFNGFKSVAPIQCATSSGHGIGKSTLVAWIIKWIMDTRPFAKGTVTANTEAQLRTKTWAELGKWHRRSMTEHWFTYNSGRGSMSLKHKKHLEEWYCSAQTCREENSEAFAGQHAANSTSFYIFDEDSAVPDKIHEVREGGTTDGEPMTFDFGNPTRNTGRFFEECEGKFRHRYTVRKIDSRTVAITNKDRIREWIEDYGIDSDFVKVRVLGEFPSAGSLQLIPTNWVQRSMLRPTIYDRFASVTIGVDVARYGDDNTVIYPLAGNDARSFAPKVGDGIYNGLDNVQVAGKVIEKVEWFRSLGVEVAAIFVDVGGLGAGVVDILTHAGYNPIPVNFGNSPVMEPDVYRYRSDEMWGRMKEGIKTDLILPSLPSLKVVAGTMIGHNGGPALTEDSGDTATKLFRELTQREFGYTLSGNKIHLETKKDMKSRGVSSPDITDALALNYAQLVAPARMPHGTTSAGGMTNSDFDPLNNVNVA